MIIMATFMISVGLLSLVGIVVFFCIGIYSCCNRAIQKLPCCSASEETSHRDIIVQCAVPKQHKKKRRHARKKKSSKSRTMSLKENDEDVPQTRTMKYSKPVKTSKSHQYDSSTMEEEPVLRKPNIDGGSGQVIEIPGFTKDDADIVYGADANFICSQAEELDVEDNDDFIMDEDLLLLVAMDDEE